MTEPRTHTLKPNVAGVLGRLQTTTNLPVDLRLGRWPTTADDEGFWILAGFLGTESLLAIFRHSGRKPERPAVQCAEGVRWPATE
jgi:hypothetical protein